MSEDKSLVIQAEGQINADFYGDTLQIATVDGVPYCPIRPITTYLGLNWSPQRIRAYRDEVIAAELKTIRMKAADGRMREMLCINLEYLPGFLFGIQVKRIKPELQEKLTRYKKNAHRVLWESFRNGGLRTTNDVQPPIVMPTPSMKALEMAKAVMQLAQNQVTMESEVREQRSAIQQTIVRLDAIEAKLGDDARFVSAEQATQISQAVKTIAYALSERSGRNEYGGVYGELYRRFGITSYKQLPAKQFKEAISFLNNWYQSLTGEEIPF